MKKAATLDCTIIAARRNVLGAYFGLRNLYLRIFDEFFFRIRHLSVAFEIAALLVAAATILSLLAVFSILVSVSLFLNRPFVKLNLNSKTADQFRSSCNAVQLDDKFCRFKNLD